MAAGPSLTWETYLGGLNGKTGGSQLLYTLCGSHYAQAEFTASQTQCIEHPDLSSTYGTILVYPGGLIKVQVNGSSTGTNSATTARRA